jgi:hypothetical protein
VCRILFGGWLGDLPSGGEGDWCPDFEYEVRGG